MTRIRVLAGAILALGFAGAPAHAGDGFYLSLEGGADAVADWQHTRTEWSYCGPDTKEAIATFETGWAGFGGFGYALGRWRLELEGGYRDNTIDSYLKQGRKYWISEGANDISGELSEASVMANVLYDIRLFDRFSLAVGAGAGGDYGRFKLETRYAPIDEEDWRFAYQGIAGLNYALTEVAVLFVNYRFADVRDISFDPTPKVHLEGDDFQKQAATIGLRFSLSGAPSPAPVSVPAPAPVAMGTPLEREFMVFFGFNQSDVTPQALETIKQAVGAVHQSGSAAIRVVGHADRAGSIAYNMALSLRRAKSVRKALIAEGIAAGAIAIAGRGESEPLVPTADGVREPQNRRVHISF